MASALRPPNLILSLGVGRNKRLRPLQENWIPLANPSSRILGACGASQAVGRGGRLGPAQPAASTNQDESRSDEESKKGFANGISFWLTLSFRVQSRRYLWSALYPRVISIPYSLYYTLKGGQNRSLFVRLLAAQILSEDRKHGSRIQNV